VAGPNFRTDNDLRFTDSTTAPDVKEHQQIHDVQGRMLNRFDDVTPSVNGLVMTWDQALQLWTAQQPGSAQSGYVFATQAEFAEAVQDVAGAMIVAGGGTYDDATGTVAFPSTASVSGLVVWQKASDPARRVVPSGGLLYVIDDLGTGTPPVWMQPADRFEVAV
jgi:hypothetical protein